MMTMPLLTMPLLTMPPLTAIRAVILVVAAVMAAARHGMRGGGTPLFAALVLRRQTVISAPTGDVWCAFYDKNPKRARRIL